MYAYSHKTHINFPLLPPVRNNFGDQPVRPAPTSAPPRHPGFGQARLRLRRATRVRVGASRARHGAPRQSRGCAPLRAGRPRSQGTAALSGDGCALRERLRSQGTAALPGNVCVPAGRPRSRPTGRARAPRERLRSQGTAALPGNVCVPAGRPRSRPTGRPRSQGTAALSGDGCAPRERVCASRTAALAPHGTPALPGNGCALRGRLRSQGTAALPGDGCSSRQVDKDCVFEPTGPVDVHAPKVPLLMHVSWSDMTRVHPELNGYEPDAHSASPAPSA